VVVVAKAIAALYKTLSLQYTTIERVLYNATIALATTTTLLYIVEKGLYIILQ
jgi:hypothetical protein